MKNLFTSLAVAAAMAVSGASVAAADSARGAFVGLYGGLAVSGFSQVKEETSRSISGSVASYEFSAVSDTVGFGGVMAGYDFGGFRLYGALEKQGGADVGASDTLLYEIDGQIGRLRSASYEATKLLFGCDWLAGSRSFKGVFGLYVGAAFVDAQATYEPAYYNYGWLTGGYHTYGAARTDDLGGTGFVLGGRVGAMVEFDEHNALEFGVKADLIAGPGALWNALFYAGYTFKF